MKKALVYLTAAMALTLVMVWGGMQAMESGAMRDRTEVVALTKTITRNGINYFPRQDITTVLLMGIDQEGPVQDSGISRNPREAEFVAVAILDHGDKTCGLLLLDRDMMVQMPVLGDGGKQDGTVFGQLALSHTYGSGLADSAENTRDTVSAFLYDLAIDYYAAMNMDAVGILHEAAGGVTVRVSDDFSRTEEALPMGEVTLTPSQALTFVRSRTDAGNQQNRSRMERQEAYLRGLTRGLSQRFKQSEAFAAEVYEKLAPYMVTDCSANGAISLLQRCAEYPLENVYIIPGEAVRAEDRCEFYADEEKLEALILELFYRPKT